MALKWLRDNLRHLKFILWGVVVVFVLLVFVDWGAGRSGGPGGVGEAVRVGKRSVSEEEFLSEMRRLDQRFSEIYGEQWNELRGQVDLAGQTASFFIDRELQLEEARRVGITVSDEELRQAILSNPSFMDENGEFVGAETYKRIIRAYFRTSLNSFEKRYTEDLIIGKLNGLVERGIWVGDEEVERELRRERELSDFDAVQLRYENNLDQITVSEDEARTMFDSTTEDYHREEQRVIRYLVVETSKLRRLLPVEEDELRAYYEEHQDEFLVGEQANARHILIRVPANASPEEQAEAELRAGSIAKIAGTGADFVELAATHSEDPGSKDNGGDLGWFARGSMVQEFEDAVFSAKPGDLVGPVKSQFGFHIIRIEGFRPEHQRPFEEVEEQVRFSVTEGRASAEAETRAISLAQRLQSEQPENQEAWQAIADEDEAVVLNQSPPFAVEQQIPGIGQATELSDEAFGAEVGDIHGPLAVPRGWIVWQLDEIRPAGVPPFADVRSQVEQTLRRQKAMEMAADQGRQLAERWRQGEDIVTLAEEFGSTVTETREHRRGTPVGTIGVVSELDEAVFAAAEGEVLGPVSAGTRGVVVAKVNSLTLVDAGEVQNELEPVRSRITAEKANQLLRAILNERRRETVVTVNNELLQRFSPTSS